jgi:hypothetical protein
MPKLYLLFAALLLAVTSPARSQSTSPSPSNPARSANSPTAAEAQAAIPKLSYRSPFADYQADKVEEPRPWRDVNDRVGTIGGWRAYAREAQQSAAPPAPAPQPATTPRN